MAHPGVLNVKRHPEGPPNGLADVHMSNFPITDEQATVAASRGDIIYDVSIGQGVKLRNGASYFHGTHDGLHVPDDQVFD